MTWNVIIKVHNGMTACVQLFLMDATIDLVTKYKDALLSGEGLLIWDGGVLRMSDVIGIYK